jgi:cyclic pyranopterin phosphate synthase
LLRTGGSDRDIAERWREAMWDKPAGRGVSDPDFVQPRRSMSAIGG